LRLRTAKILFAAFAAVLIALNGVTLLSAIPYTGGTQVFCDSHVGCIVVARDFSAYYEAGYRFIHDPTQVYHEGNLTGDYQILPNPQNFRYAPFFLPLFMVPLVAVFDYQNALRAFDVIQFALLPLVAYLLFEMMRWFSGRGQSVDRPTFAGFSLALLLTILQPYVPSLSDVSSGIWSWSYWRLWVEGEARVLQTALLVLTFCLILRDSRFAGLAFVLSSFDPRMSVLSLPLILFLCLKMGNLRRFVATSLVSFAAVYAPTLLYANLGSQFGATAFIRDFSIYSYEYVPVVSVAAITATVLLLELSKRRGAQSARAAL